MQYKLQIYNMASTLMHAKMSRLTYEEGVEFKIDTTTSTSMQ
jgi:hypothetical protein